MVVLVWIMIRVIKGVDIDPKNNTKADQRLKIL